MKKVRAGSHSSEAGADVLAVDRSCAIYRRRSKKVRPGDDDPATIARQDEDCRQWAEREGITVAEVFTDMLSGYRQDVARPQFAAAVDWAAAAPGRTLLVWKLDRLSRRGMGQVGDVLDRLDATGGRVVFLKDGLDSSTPGHRMVIAILSEQARQESANTSLRTRAGMETRRTAGRWLGGRPPFGYRVVCPVLPSGADPASFHVDPDGVAGRLVLDPERGAVLADIVRRVLDGASLYDVARTLSVEGVPTARGGASWRAGTVAQMLRSPVLVGWLPRTVGSTEPARHPETAEPIEVAEPVITVAERRRLLALVEARAVRGPLGRPVRGRPARSLLTGLLRCGSCNGPMVLSGLHYGCTNRAEGGHCVGGTVGRKSAEEFVAHKAIARLAALDAGDPILDDVARRLLGLPDVPAVPREVTEAEAEAAEVAARLEDLEEAYFVRGDFPGADGKARYERLHKALSDKLATLDARTVAATPAEPDIGALLDPVELRERWADIPTEYRRAALAAVIDHIVVRKAERQGGTFDGERRMSITWRMP